MFTPYVETPQISEISFCASDEKTTHSIFTHCGVSHGAYAHKHWTSTTTSILDYSKMLLNLGCCYTVMKMHNILLLQALHSVPFDSIFFRMNSLRIPERLCLNKRPSLIETSTKSLHYRFEACLWSIWYFPCWAASVTKNSLAHLFLGKRYFKASSRLS